MTTLPDLVTADCGSDYTHLVAYKDQVIASCNILHPYTSFWETLSYRCDVADNWVLVRPSLHSFS